MENLENYQGDQDLVRKQLLKILSSYEFKNSQVLSRFLQFVVEEFLAERPNEIKEYTIGVRALGRSADFNPQTDAVVRIHAGRLRRILHEYYHATGLHDPILIDIPKGSYVPVFKVLNVDNPVVNKTNDVSLLKEEVSPRKAPLPYFLFITLVPTTQRTISRRALASSSAAILQSSSTYRLFRIIQPIRLPQKRKAAKYITFLI